MATKTRRSAAETRPLVPTKEKEREIYETPAEEEVELVEQEDVNFRQSTEIDTTPSKPVVAFEKFAGKTFDLRSADYSDSVRSWPPAVYSLASRNEKSLESPLETYNRLKLETQQLQEHLEAISQELKGDTSSIFPPELLAELKKMQSELTTIATDPRFGGILVPTQSSSAELDPSSVIADLQYYEAKGASGSGGEAEGEAGAGAGAGAGAEAGAVVRGGLTCELFLERGGGLNQLSSADISLTQLHERVTHLENIVGSSTGPPNKDLKTTTAELVRKVQMLDPAFLELLYVRLQTLGKTIDAFTSQRKQIPKEMIQDRKIETLFETIGRVEGVIPQVPVLIARLQSLQRIHEGAAAFVTNLDRLQNQQTAISNRLSSQNKSLTQVEASMKSNFQALLNGFQETQKRMAALEQKMSQL